MTARILVADDDPALLEMMRLTLAKEGFRVATASTSAAAREAIVAGALDLLVSDIYLGDGTALDLLEEVRDHHPDAAVILVTAKGTVETAAEAAAAGVFDYLAKPFRLEELVGRVRAALGDHPGSPAQVIAGPESRIIGSHPRMVEVYKAVARVAPLAVPVLIRGETGTGKELVARAIHTHGRDPDDPFVAINCGAIPEALLESELFGHRRGSFTGAVRDHVGAVESARGGTVLLDEVGELPPLLQVKLLRFLQDGEIRPVGAERGLTVPVRVLAATHRDLRSEADSGRFREDFYFRVAAYEILLPPLRERSSDIPALVDHFWRRSRAALGCSEDSGASRETLELLQGHHWPGNVRELENLVQRALVDLGSLGDHEGVARLLGAMTNGAGADVAPVLGDDLTLEDVERLHIAAVLRRCGNNRTRAAVILGIERKSLYRKARRLGIDLDDQL